MRVQNHQDHEGLRWIGWIARIEKLEKKEKENKTNLVVWSLYGEGMAELWRCSKWQAVCHCPSQSRDPTSDCRNCSTSTSQYYLN
jgi:hypothetical protein